ncbi:hydrogen gas-evolving membrane-bound hydrogenase subunit E [Nocardioides ferulae]|uniref:hydrogen gas-evolving membrane-bound hydrogenase subunit E n=1 Tax=Nocardioides ferulae TaxID=2340821 RepID=UPI00197DEF85|nr:hydrogen gas-evolving membrane-bound hydrogenase subunit E [Nocardioides ferulae]
MLLALGVLTAMAVLSPVLARRGCGRELGYLLAASFLGVAAVIAAQVPRILDGGTVETSVEWLPSLGVTFALRLDGLSSLFALMVLGVGALILAYCPRYLGPQDPHGAVYGLLTLFAAAMLGLVLAADVVLLFVFWEATTFCSFLLLGLAGGKATRPARRALLITAAGGLALLVAVVLLTAVTGSTVISDIVADREVILESPLALPIGALVAFAAFTKSAQVPLHFWLPGAMVAMTPVSAFLHAATMVKAGVYLLMRVSPIFAGLPAWSALLVSVGLTSALWGAFMALRQHDLKAILAHSTVSQLGLLVAAIGVGTSIALAAAMLHTIAHALFKATLFMLIGIIDKEAGSRDIRKLSGLWRVMPVTATMTALAGLSMAGIVPMLGFVSKEYLFQGFFQTDFAPAAGVVAGAIAVAASALTAAYGLRIFYGAFGGTRQPGLYEPSPAFLAPAAVAALTGLLLGPGIDLLNPLVARAGADVVPGQPLAAFEFWHGLSPEIVMSGIAISTGLLLFLRRHHVDRLLDRIAVPDAGAAFDRGHARLISFGYRIGQPDRADGTVNHLVRPLLGALGLALVGFLAVRDLPEVRPSDTAADWVVAGLVALGVAATLATRNTLAALASLGFVGLLMAALFVSAGAPDVALTLVLVEVLTAVVVVWVLRRLPTRLPAVERRRLWGAGMLAIACGLAAASATYALTGRRSASVASEYFLDNAEAATGGTNVVNTILVDFRAMDTLGEAVVLAVVAIGLLALLGPAGGGVAEPRASTQDRDSAAAEVFLQASARLVVPGAALVAAYLLYVGHDAPGGGFIAALVAGAAAAVHQLAHGQLPRWLGPEQLVGCGILVCVGTATLALAMGEAVLAPFKLPGLEVLGVGSALIFDIGVMLMVLGMLVAALDRFGADTRRSDPLKVHP